MMREDRNDFDDGMTEDFESDKVSRATRRHHASRKRKQAKHLVSRWGVEDVEEKACRMGDNMKQCSCYMCGNQRKFGVRTKQEILAELDYEESLQELEEYDVESLPDDVEVSKEGREE